MLDACMHMWGQLIPKKGQLDFPIFAFGRDVCDLLASRDNLVLDIVQYPYAGMDWRGFLIYVDNDGHPPIPTGTK